MIGIISLLIPPFVCVCIREKIVQKEETALGRMLHYAISLLAHNFVMMLILCYGFDSRDNLFGKLNQYNEFALKYMSLSMVLAVAEPFAERFVRKKVAVTVKWNRRAGLLDFIFRKRVVGIYAAVLFLLNLARIFDNNFWGDEAYSLNLIQRTVPEIIKGTASDVHPPLYYMFLRLAYLLFGNQGWAYHLVSLIPCGII